MKLKDFPVALYELEMQLITSGRIVGNERQAVRRIEATLAMQASRLPKDDYPNQDARNAWLEEQKLGEDCLTHVRKLEQAEDAYKRLEAELTKVRREWKVSQIKAQFDLRAKAERLDDERPEDPAPVDTYENDGLWDGPGAIGPQDDCPF